jgi:hypothetical protein
LIYCAARVETGQPTQRRSDCGAAAAPATPLPPPSLPTTQTGQRRRPLLRCAERPRLPRSATSSPRQRGVSPGAGGRGGGYPLGRSRSGRGGVEGSHFLSPHHSIRHAHSMLLVCTNLHVHVCQHGSSAGFSLSSGVAVIGSQPCGRAEGWRRVVARTKHRIRQSKIFLAQEIAEWGSC